MDLLKLFSAQYDRKPYLQFLQSFLPDDFTPKSEAIAVQEMQYIQSVQLLGTCDSLGLKVYEAEHSSENDPRVGISREVFRVLATYGVAKALVFFTSKKSINYRFSYVSLNLELEGSKVKKSYTNPRRFSYFLGPEAKVGTPVRQLSVRINSLEELEKAFSLEVVNKEFYDQIAQLFSSLVGGERRVGAGTKRFKTGLKLPGAPSHQKYQEFSVRLIGRLIFCWFLKKKKSKEGLALIQDEILSLQGIRENYYHAVLENLFFQVLNTPFDERDARFKEKPWSDIPFLNGGLFESHDDDHYSYEKFSGTSKAINTLKISDDWFRDIFNLFETYNFTIDENTSVDVDLSIDPEMLGRIFENLLAEINPETEETARKSTGSFYTPRTIVDYMVDESLKIYLQTKTGIEENKISELLSYSDSQFKPNSSQTVKLINALDELKVLDPACGSGAFPMGILQRILTILQKIDPESQFWLQAQLDWIGDSQLKLDLKEKLKNENFNYIHKMGIIRRCLFGIDIQPIAVEIAKLRCFLTLVVDENVNDSKPNRNIKPLPNLEFRFVCADSIKKLPALKKTTLFDTEDNESIEQLKKIRERYFSARSFEKKELIKNFKTTQETMKGFYLSKIVGSQRNLVGDIKNTKKQSEPELTQLLSNWEPFSDEPCNWFDPDWMFGVKDGFDILIGNPPYVSHDKIKNKANIKSDYETYEPFADLYCYFLERGLKLLNKTGVICFITSNSYLRADYGFSLRQFIQNNFYLNALINIEDTQVFDSAIVNTSVICAQNKIEKEQPLCLIVNKTLEVNDYFQDFIKKNKFYYKQSDFSAKSWNLIPEEFINLKKKIEGGTKTLESLNTKIRLGLATGANEAFIIDEKLKQKLIDEDKNNKNIIKPILRGRDIHRFSYHIPEKYIILAKNGVDIKKEYPTVYKYLESFGPKLKNRGAQGQHWTNLRACAFFDDFKEEKIVWIELTDRGRFAYCSDEIYLLNSAYFLITPKSLSAKYLLALLNSKVIYFYLGTLAETSGMGTLRWINNYVKEFPVPELALEKHKPLIKLVDQIMKLKEKDPKTDTTALEQEIDEYVYKIYHLNQTEIDLIENFVNRTTGTETVNPEMDDSE